MSRETRTSGAAYVGFALLAAAMLSVAASPADAGQVVLHFWGDYIKNPAFNQNSSNRYFRSNNGAFDGNLDLDSDGAFDDSRVTYRFSLNEPLNPLGDDGYGPTLSDGRDYFYREDEHGARFYGGIQARYLNAQVPVIHQAYVHFEGANLDYPDPVSGRPLRSDPPGYAPVPSTQTGVDGNSRFTEITLFTYHAPDFVGFPQVASSFESAFLWKSDDFVGVAPGQRVSFDQTSEVLITTTRKWANLDQSRFAVQNGDTFYLSSGWLGQADLAGFDVVRNPADMLWAEWDPLSDPLDFSFDPFGTMFGPRVFDDVRAFGVYISQPLYSSAETKLTFDQFRLTATIGSFDQVPEPAGFIVACLVAAMALPESRRRPLRRGASNRWT